MQATENTESTESTEKAGEVGMAEFFTQFAKKKGRDEKYGHLLGKSTKDRGTL